MIGNGSRRLSQAATVDLSREPIRGQPSLFCLMLFKFFKRLFAALFGLKPRIIFNRIINPDGSTTYRKKKDMLKLQAGNSLNVGVTAVDAFGNPTALDGAVKFSSSDELLLTLTSIDNVSATLTAVGPVGSVQIIAEGDADLGEGVKAIFGQETVEIVAGDAVGIAIKPL